MYIYCYYTVYFLSNPDYINTVICTFQEVQVNGIFIATKLYFLSDPDYISTVICTFQEVLVNGIFIPTVDLLSDPDYINSYIAWLVSYLQ